MDLTFANPAGLWALLGVPAVLAIHFLQRRSQEVPVTTLFLLEQMRRESVQGSRFERLRSSVPLWLQLLSVLLLAWLLADPHWRREDSVQRIAVVVDNSASMSAFREETREALASALARLEPVSARRELLLLESTDAGRRLYRGMESRELLEALDRDWLPRFGAHDPGPALRVARSLVGPRGLLVFLTDHAPERDSDLGFGAAALAVGTPIDNAGFAGLRIEEKGGQLVWSALIRNYADTPATRAWHLRAGGLETAPRTVTLDARQTVTIQGPFVEGAERAVLVLDDDAFPADDRLPMVRPAPKRLSLRVQPSLEEDEFLARLIATFPAVDRVAEPGEADLAAVDYSPLEPSLPEQAAIVFVRDPRKDIRFSPKQIIAENHPLTDGLNWQGLIARETLAIPGTPDDEVLLWQGDAPLVFLRDRGGRPLLCFNFDPRKSNADRLAAFVVMIHRFLENRRAVLVAEWAGNLETGQDVPLAFDASPDAPELIVRHHDGAASDETDGGIRAETFPIHEASRIDAPPLPGFFEVFQGDRLLVRAAAHFADTREADFRDAASTDEVSGKVDVVAEQHLVEDTHWRLWLLLLLAILVVAWWFVARPASGPRDDDPDRSRSRPAGAPDARAAAAS